MEHFIEENSQWHLVMDLMQQMDLIMEVLVGAVPHHTRTTILTRKGCLSCESGRGITWLDRVTQDSPLRDHL